MSDIHCHQVNQNKECPKIIGKLFLYSIITGKIESKTMTLPIFKDREYLNGTARLNNRPHTNAIRN